ncbi:MAG: glycolate oxidase iron-sulfur subunit [Alphaproteobacteria bacterium]|nr:glycolate oxidase iron-sulfur subunit [Alphaproteobacteria bacterium]
MQTHFSLAQLADPNIAEANQILRNCVHCGFCTATCPTYVLRGDELDSPRGRIYLIKQMLESGEGASARVARHIDRCLSCLSCMTTCPSGVHYMHLVDHAREVIEETYERPFAERKLRDLLAWLLPRPNLFRLALIGAWFAKPFAALAPGRLKALLSMAPSQVPAPSSVDRPQVHAADGARKGRVALLTGCAQKVLNPAINEATIRLLNRHGIEVVVTRGVDCCGALTHHMGRTADSHAKAAVNVRAWTAEIESEGLDAIIINVSGCGTTVKDYGFMFRGDSALREQAERVSALTRDISEYLLEIGLDASAPQEGVAVAYHAACSLQHGQKITEAPKILLAEAGFDVKAVPEAHLCCGSAGTYNLLQPELATQLRDRKLANIARTGASVVAAGNIGCIQQIAAGELPVVHTVELLDWATGGPPPAALNGAGTA